MRVGDTRIYILYNRIEVFKVTHRIEGLDSGMFFNYIGQTTEHEDIVGRWLKNGAN